MAMLLRERLTRPGPKRILALDGGGVRGALTLGFLERMEGLLRDRYDNPDLRLRDYFDLIGGTSTGSIIAVGLAIGMDVAELKEVYRTIGPAVFSRGSMPLVYFTPRVSVRRTCTPSRIPLAASVFASSVFPTPVGPANKNDPIGL